MKVGIIGSGYVGLVTGLSLSARGHEVVCLDSDAKKVEMISKGLAPFHEPGLEGMLSEGLQKKVFRAEEGILSAVSCDVLFIAVPTPCNPENGRMNSQFLEAVALSLGKIVGEKGAQALTAIFVKSTVIPGTTRSVFQKVFFRGAGAAGRSVHVGMMPEFLREGSAVEDAMRPDRIVIGADDPALFDTVKSLYCLPSDPVPLATSIETAEMIKYVNNSLLSLCISFSNEVASLAEAVNGVDAQHVLDGVLADRRWRVDGHLPAIGEYFKPGCGFGGSCFPKDVRALASFAKDNQCDSFLIPDILAVNQRQAERLVRRVENRLKGLKGTRVLVLGLAFKPNTDDVRESPAFSIVEHLERCGATVVCHDPVAENNFFNHFNGAAQRVKNWEAELPLVDVVFLVTLWSDYVLHLPERLSGQKKSMLLVDGRGVFRANSWPESISYLTVGRKDESDLYPDVTPRVPLGSK